MNRICNILAMTLFILTLLKTPERLLHAFGSEDKYLPEAPASKLGSAPPPLTGAPEPELGNQPQSLNLSPALRSVDTDTFTARPPEEFIDPPLIENEPGQEFNERWKHFLKRGGKRLRLQKHSFDVEEERFLDIQYKKRKQFFQKIDKVRGPERALMVDQFNQGQETEKNTFMEEQNNKKLQLMLQTEKSLELEKEPESEDVKEQKYDKSRMKERIGKKDSD